MMRKTHKKKNASCDASTHASPETTNKKVKSVGGGKETRSWPINSPSLHPPLAGYLAPRRLHCRRRLVGGSRPPGAGRYPSPRRRLSTSDGGAALGVVRPAGAPIIHQVTSGSERGARGGGRRRGSELVYSRFVCHIWLTVTVVAMRTTVQ